MVRAHLLWDYGRESDFISWSSSILWVLEHAARMHTYEHKRNVHVAVMDTRKIHDMAIFPATTLMNVYGIPVINDPQAHKLNKDYYTAEYLFHGPLRNSISDPCYKAVEWEHICKSDLWNMLRIFSERSSFERELFLRIEQHRCNFESGAAAPQGQDIVPILAPLGALFGNEFQVVVIFALATLLRGQQTPRAPELAQALSKLQLPPPHDLEGIIRFECVQYVDIGLTEVTRMYRSLGEILTLEKGILQQELPTAVDNMSTQG